MKPYLIGYDLRRPGQDYPKLFEAIMLYETYWRFLDSTWIVVTRSSASQIRDHLQQFIDQNDKLFVGGLTGEAAWYGLSADGSQWMKRQLAA